MSTPVHEFTLVASSLDAAGQSFRFPIRAAWIRGVLEGDGGDSQGATGAGPDGLLDIRASKGGDNVVVHGSLKAELTVPCARCLEPAKVTVDQPISVLYAPRHSIHETDGDDEYEHAGAAGEADLLPYDGETVILDDLVRDELLLEIPMIPLCSEDCPGMSPPPDSAKESQVSSDRPIDPRLAPLLRFKKLS